MQSLAGTINLYFFEEENSRIGQNLINLIRHLQFV